LPSGGPALAELALRSRFLIGPLSGTALFLLLAGGRLPGARLQLRRALAIRWLGFCGGACLEELVWRGLVLGGLATAVGVAPGLALSSAGFAVWHRPALGCRCAVHLVTGIGFGSAFLAAGLVAAMLAHGVYNVLVDWAVQAERSGRAT
jgi:membrane protease YdiL (CAAX protease family)